MWVGGQGARDCKRRRSAAPSRRGPAPAAPASPDPSPSPAETARTHASPPRLRPVVARTASFLPGTPRFDTPSPASTASFLLQTTCSTHRVCVRITRPIACSYWFGHEPECALNLGAPENAAATLMQRTGAPANAAATFTMWRGGFGLWESEREGSGVRSAMSFRCRLWE